MSSFTAVTTGANTLASDINQYANILNGSTAGQVLVSGGAGTFLPFLAQQSAITGSPEVFGADESGDAHYRIALYMRSDTYGGLYAGSGASVTAHLYAMSGGWKIDESLTVSTNLTVNGASSFAGISNSGTFSSDAGKIVSDGAGHLQLNSRQVPTADGTMTFFRGASDPTGSFSVVDGDVWFPG